MTIFQSALQVWLGKGRGKDFAARMTSVLALLMLCACGGGDLAVEASSAVKVGSRRAALAVRTPDATALFDWAEKAYPDFFPGHQENLSSEPYVYRYYPQTGNYVGVSGQQVYILGPVSGHVLTSVGAVTEFGCKVYPQDCVAPVMVDQPKAISVRLGGEALFTSSVRSSSPVSYQWWRGGQPIAGATGNTLRIPTIGFGEDGVGYFVEVANAYGSTRSTAATLSVTPSGSVTNVNACRVISAPGSYALTADLRVDAASSACISIENVAQVQLDCKGHTISVAASGAAIGRALGIAGAHSFSIKNCLFEAAWTEIADSSNGSLTHNTWQSKDSPFQFAVIESLRNSTLVFRSNAVIGSYQQIYATNSSILENQLTMPAGVEYASSVLSSMFGNGNGIWGNTVVGHWDRAMGVRNGADGGLLLQDEAGSSVERNTISDVSNCAISLVGALTSARIGSNHIFNARLCGIGGWAWLSLSGVSVSNNAVEGSERLFSFYRMYGLRPAGFDQDKRMPADKLAQFANNVFEGNRLAAPSISSGGRSWMPLDASMGYSTSVSGLVGEHEIASDQFDVRNNVFKNNDFGARQIGPYFGQSPLPGAAVDEGGNRCLSPTGVTFPSETDYPIICQ